MSCVSAASYLSRSGLEPQQTKMPSSGMSATT